MNSLLGMESHVHRFEEMENENGWVDDVVMKRTRWQQG